MKPNHFDLTDSAIDEENEFLLSSPPSRITHTGKDDMIRKLQQKNERLQAEIQKIQHVLSLPGNKTIYGVKIPQVRNEVTNKQLENAYKQIKAYEYEVKKLREIQKDGLYVEQTKKIQRILKQKEELSEKLRREVGQLKRTSMDITKALKNDNKKGQYETKISILSSQVKWLRQKVKDMEEKRQTAHHNREQQLQFIRKLESELINNGFGSAALVSLRNKFATQEMHQTGYSKLTKNEEKEYVEDRTPQTYRSLLTQIKLYQKLQKDHLNQLNTLEKEKNQAETLNFHSRNKVLQVEDEIDQVQRRIAELKPMIDPRNLKPTRALSLKKNQRYGENNKSLGSIKGGFTHIFKNDEIGSISKGGRRFTDRLKIGKFPAKIVGVDFYVAKNNIGNVVGLQATYEVKKAIKKCPLNMIFDSKKTAKVPGILVDGTDYFKAIECITNDKGLVLGLVFLSQKGVTVKAGIFDGPRKPMSIDRNEHPACLYGSFSEQGIELFGAEIVQDEDNG